jgi:hypothetical protein
LRSKGIGGIIGAMQNLSLCIRKAHVVAPGRDLGGAGKP